MTNTELILNMLAEASTTEISKKHQPETIDENIEIAKKGGNVAKSDRLQLEKDLGNSVISPLNAKNYLKKIKPTETNE